MDKPRKVYGCPEGKASEGDLDECYFRGGGGWQAKASNNNFCDVKHKHL
jgi:hypothetical protein